MRLRSRAGHRRGGVYVAVLGTAVVVSLIGLASLSTVRSQRLTANQVVSGTKARAYAYSGVDLAMQLIAADANWRTNRASGVWVNKQALGDGLVSVSVVDPVDGNLANRPTDSVTIQSTGYQGAAVQTVQVTATASGAALDALGAALHTGGQLHVVGNTTVQGAPLSTNGALHNASTVNGDVQCFVATQAGTVNGSLTIVSAAKSMPSSGIVAMYTALGTAISPASGTMNKVLLSPAANPYGATNADGVYVITTNSAVTISNCRIVGTLVVVCPGKTVTIDTGVFMQPARPDYPALIVDGNLVVQSNSAAPLSEASAQTNFNPAGTPYLGATDSDTLDQYPCEIDGLVHVRGTFATISGPTFRGAIICESAAATDAVSLGGTPLIVYDPSLATSPPMGYAKSVSMGVKAGTWKQVVGP